MEKNENNIIICQDENGITKVGVRFADEELEQNQTNKKFLLVQIEENRQIKRNIDYYNLDMIIALGYRI